MLKDGVEFAASLGAADAQSKEEHPGSKGSARDR